MCMSAIRETYGAISLSLVGVMEMHSNQIYVRKAYDDFWHFLGEKSRSSLNVMKLN